MDLAKKVKLAKIPENSIGIYWLGQAGFLIKLSNGKIIAIDPYLSDSCEKEYGSVEFAFNNFKRIMPSAVRSEDLEVDLILSSHEHYDHLDIYAVPILLNKTGTKLAGPESVIKKCKEINVKEDKLIKLEKGSEVDFGYFKLLPVDSDHGELEPYAVGFIMNFGNFKLYYPADTSYTLDRLGPAIKEKTDIIIPPVNGLYGNLNCEEAAKLSRDTGAKVCIPCHYWMFIEHGGDPVKLYDYLKEYAPDCKVKYLSIGEEFVYPDILD